MDNTHSHHWAEGGDAAADLEKMAVEWFFRREGGLTADEEQAFTHWLEESESHRRAYADVEGTWRTLGQAKDQVIAATKLPERVPHDVRRLSRVQAALAAAAAIAVAWLGWWWLAPDSSSLVEQVATEVDGLRRMDLPDGSRVTLNSDSAMDVQITAKERRIRLLRGEAFFTVAKDPRRPFVVEGYGVAVTAIGTAFNVRLRSEAVEVLVSEGTVRVDDAARGGSLVAAPSTATAPSVHLNHAEGHLHAGRKIVIPVGTSAAPVPAVAAAVAGTEIDQALAWQKRRLEYVDVPLSEIVADFNRYNQHRLVIADPSLGARRFGGSFPAGDYGSLVQLLERTFDVRVERRARETVLRLP